MSYQLKPNQIETESALITVLACDTTWANVSITDKRIREHIRGWNLMQRVSVPDLVRDKNGISYVNQMTFKTYDQLLNDNREVILKLINELNRSPEIVTPHVLTTKQLNQKETQPRLL